MKIEKLDHVHVRVKDIDKAYKALSASLGPDFHTFAKAGSSVLDLTEHRGMKMARHNVGLNVMEVTNPALAGERGKGPQGVVEGVVTISFKVADMDEAVAEVKSRGARILEEVSMGQLRETLFEFPGLPWVQFEFAAYPGTSGAAAAEM